MGRPLKGGMSAKIKGRGVGGRDHFALTDELNYFPMLEWDFPAVDFQEQSSLFQGEGTL